MKNIRNFAKQFACFWIATAFPIAARAVDLHQESKVDDHLIPVAGRVEPQYQKLLSQRLFLTPANYCRIVELSSAASVGEVVVAIYSKQPDAGHPFVTITRGEKNLWYADFGEDPNFPKTPRVKVSRCDAAFPLSAAIALRHGIGRAVRATRALENRDNRVIVDATDIEFSVGKTEKGRARGLLTGYSGGRTAMTLRRIMKLLKDYCDAPLTAKNVIARKIEAEASRLDQTK